MECHKSTRRLHQYNVKPSEMRDIVPPGNVLPLECLNFENTNITNLTIHGLLSNTHACDVIMVVRNHLW